MNNRSGWIAALLVFMPVMLLLQSCSSFMDNDEFEMTSSNDSDFYWTYDSNLSQGAGYRFVKQQNPKNYTVQVAIGKQASQVDQKLAAANVGCNPIHYYVKQGKDVQEGVACGTFSTLAEAHAFRLQLPSGLNTDVAGVYQWRTIQKRAVPY